VSLFNDELQNIDIEPVLTENDPEISYQILMKEYMKLFNKHFPKVTLENNKRKIPGLIKSSRNY